MAMSTAAITSAHLPVFTTTDQLARTHNAPALTTIYTPPVGCGYNEWLLADQNFAPIVKPWLTRRDGPADVTYEAQLRPRMTTTSRQSVATPLTGPTKRDADRLTVWSVRSNPNFSSCRPDSGQPFYSPGVCPDGHTVAELTEFHASRPSGMLTSWIASCCRSGMTIGSDEVVSYCVSSISTPLQARAMVTQTLTEMSDGKTTLHTTLVYEYLTVFFTESTGVYRSSPVSSTVSSMTTVTSALAVADPYVVAWQRKDLSLFPTAYAASLAHDMGVSIASMGDSIVYYRSAVASGDWPLETGASPASHELSTAAKAGVGVGSAFGGVIIAASIFILWLKMRRKCAVSERRLSTQETRDVHEIEDSSGRSERPMWFVGGRWRNEAHADVVAQELEVPPQELEDTVRELEALALELDSKAVHVQVEPVADLETQDASPGSKEWLR